MLARKVKVNIYGSPTQGLYFGYANADGISNMSAYVLSKKKPYESFHGTVVAVLTLTNSKTCLVVAPDGEIYYEPEIKEHLDALHNIKVQNINCLYEKSCGAIIIYHPSQNDYRVLLVKNHNGRYWSFPKGHVEKGENEQQTAIREIKEETGLDVEIVDGFREVSDYCPFGKIKKRVVFFMAQAFSPDVVIQKEEIDSYIWVKLENATDKCTYENDLRVIKKAKVCLSKLK